MTIMKVLWLSLVLLCGVPIALSSLEDEHYLSHIYETFYPIFQRDRPIANMQQFAVMTFDWAGNQGASPLEPSALAVNEFENRYNYVAATPLQIGGRRYHAEENMMYAITDEGMVDNFRTRNGRPPNNIHIVTYNSPCEYCAETIISILSEYAPQAQVFVAYIDTWQTGGPGSFIRAINMFSTHANFEMLVEPLCTQPTPSTSHTHDELRKKRMAPLPKCSKVPVYHVPSPNGRYKYTYGAAKQACEDNGHYLATKEDLNKAWELGYDMCRCGWLADGQVFFPTQVARKGCGTKGLNYCPENPAEWGQSGWDAYCVKGKTMPVYHIQSPNGRYKYNFEAAKKTCEGNGHKLATKGDLNEALQLGYDMCQCGWLADRQVFYPTQFSRSGCGKKGLNYCPTNPATWGQSGWDAYCTQDKEIMVLHMDSEEGRYKYTFEQAKLHCANVRMKLATRYQLTEAQSLGYDVCRCGWLADGSVAYPITKPRSGCGTEAPGIRTCPSNPKDWGQTGYDAYCHP